MSSEFEKLRKEDPELARQLAEDNVYLCPSMRTSIEAGEKIQDAVLEATYEFFTLLHLEKPTNYSEKRSIELLKSGNVDLLATFGQNDATLFGHTNHDPHYCLDAILRSPYYADPKVFGHRAILFVHASTQGWEKTLLKCFEHPLILEEQLLTRSWKTGLFRNDMPDLFDSLHSKGLIDQDLAKDIAQSTNADKCYQKLVETGWTLPDELIRSFVSLNSERLQLVLDRGADAGGLRAWVKEHTGKAVPTHRSTSLEKFAPKVFAMNAHWKTVQTKLAAGDVQTLEEKDLIIAGNMGDEALRQFVNPKHWRKPEDKAHLLELLEHAPVQVTSRISNQIEVLKGSNAHSNGWGRA